MIGKHPVVMRSICSLPERNKGYEVVEYSGLSPDSRRALSPGRHD